MKNLFKYLLNLFWTKNKNLQESVKVGDFSRFEKLTLTTNCGNFSDTKTKKHGKLHSFDDKPSLVRKLNKSGFVIMEQWHRDGKYHRDSGPAVVLHHKNDKDKMYLAYNDGNISSNEEFEKLGVCKSGNLRLTYKPKKAQVEGDK